MNGWQVTKEAFNRDLQTFIGKAFIVTKRADHPSPRTQEAERDGTITKIGIDNTTDKAWAVAEITDAETWKMITGGEIAFVSPSLSVEHGDLARINGKDVATKFIGEHVAGVKEPAFGKVKAQIKGTCSGTPDSCMNHFQYVQASLDGLSMEECLKNKADRGITIDDKAKAICYNETKNASCSQECTCDKCKNSSYIANIGQSNLMTDSQPPPIVAPVTAVPNADVEAQFKEVSVKLENLEKENNSLKAQLDHEMKKPIVDRIIAAKIALGKIKDEEKVTHSEELFKRETATLTELVAEYESIAALKKESANTPLIRYTRNASINPDVKYDDLVARIHRL